MHDFYADKTVLVTGAAGFIGSHLVDSLLAAGATVIGVDNLLTGREENIAHLFEGGRTALTTLRQPSGEIPATNNAAFAFITANVIAAPDTYLPEDMVIDVVFHLASPASPPRYQEFPVDTYLVNSVGTHQLLSFLKETQPNARFIFASTSEVYGDPQVHPQTEDYWGNVNPNGPRSCYDEAKRLGESICGVFSRDFNVDVRIVRIFNTYGPRMDPEDGRVIPNFVKQSLANDDLTVYGEGDQTRSYCFVEDLVRGFMLVGSNDNISGETYNMGNPDEYTIAETAEIIQKATQSTGSLVYQSLPVDDPQRRKPDISKITKKLGWTPQVSFAQGLEETIRYFKEQTLSNDD